MLSFAKYVVCQIAVCCSSLEGRAVMVVFFFTRHEELKVMLDGNKDNLKLEAMKHVIGVSVWVRGECVGVLSVWMRGERVGVLSVWMRGECVGVLIVWMRGECVGVWMRGECVGVLSVWMRGERVGVE